MVLAQLARRAVLAIIARLERHPQLIALVPERLRGVGGGRPASRPATVSEADSQG
jgi:hypothetical protein